MWGVGIFHDVLIDVSCSSRACRPLRRLSWCPQRSSERSRASKGPLRDCQLDDWSCCELGRMWSWRERMITVYQAIKLYVWYPISFKYWRNKSRKNRNKKIDQIETKYIYFVLLWFALCFMLLLLFLTKTDHYEWTVKWKSGLFDWGLPYCLTVIVSRG